jgi:hypothetical protein
VEWKTTELHPSDKEDSFNARSSPSEGRAEIIRSEC